MATDTAEHAAGTCVDAGGSAIGMPQLCIDWFPNQIFWLVIALVAIYLILTKVALPRIATVLAERQGTITNDIAGAEELKLKAQEAEKTYQKALMDARAEAQKIIGEAKAEMQTELDAATADADAQIGEKATESEKRIAEIRDGALEAVKTVSADAVGAILTSLGGKADAKAIKAAVSQRAKG